MRTKWVEWGVFWTGSKNQRFTVLRRRESEKAARQELKRLAGSWPADKFTLVKITFERAS